MNNWDRSWFWQDPDSDGQRIPICMRHNLLLCGSQRCTFVHRWAVPEPDGTMCSSTDHKAITCLHRSRRVSTLGQLPAPNSATSVGRPLPKSHYISYTTERCTQQSFPTRAQKTDPMISLDMPAKSTSPLSCTGPQCNSKTTEKSTHEQ